VNVTGQTASITVGGRCAARMGKWRLSGTPSEGWSVEADLLEVNTIWLESATALMLSLDVGTKRWNWRGVSVERSGNHITVTGAGAPEVR
jgi:hypothetical protein